ncbi:MAG: tRNA lysidine(34) synthetase TilS [Clostridia bacterium]|nr:tRNA lysidine(34) synthetase TilS [Clostridia bacterium]
MQDKLLAAVTRYNLLKTGDRVTVALSGGADSTALLYGLLALREKFDLTVTAAHVNHMLRGEESDRDERFVRDLCEKLGVALSVGKFDIPALRKKGESGEECARRVRYAFLAEVADGKIATAHTADDNAETVLFNLIRGAGITGACGIPVKRDNIIRPLILCSRKDIENYCEKNGISFVTDSSNLTDDYTRNRIRHKIIPEMKEINPSLCDGVSRFSETLRDADELILSLAERAIKSAKKADGYDCGELKKAIAPFCLAPFDLFASVKRACFPIRFIPIWFAKLFAKTAASVS